MKPHKYTHIVNEVPMRVWTVSACLQCSGEECLSLAFDQFIANTVLNSLCDCEVLINEIDE